MTFIYSIIIIISIVISIVISIFISIIIIIIIIVIIIIINIIIIITVIIIIIIIRGALIWKGVSNWLVLLVSNKNIVNVKLEIQIPKKGFQKCLRKRTESQRNNPKAK